MNMETAFFLLKYTHTALPDLNQSLFDLFSVVESQLDRLS